MKTISDFKWDKNAWRNVNYPVEPWANIYLVTKKGNRFAKYSSTRIDKGNGVIEWVHIPDTLVFDLWSKSFPYDERFIIYTKLGYKLSYHRVGN